MISRLYLLLFLACQTTRTTTTVERIKNTTRTRRKIQEDREGSDAIADPSLALGSLLVFLLIRINEDINSEMFSPRTHSRPEIRVEISG